jgi:micrococcal nuclease
VRGTQPDAQGTGDHAAMVNNAESGDPSPRHRSRPHIASCLLASLLGLVLVSQAWPATQFTGRVVGIQDGDTLEVLQEGKAVRVRLHGIDTPERRQAFGTRARQFTADLAFKQQVTVLVRDTDRYGRVVGEMLLPSGRHLNRELVRAGLAWWYRKYAPNDTTLARLEAEARQAKRGLWSEGALGDSYASRQRR